MALVKSTNVSMSYATNRLNTLDENCFINKLPTSSQATCQAAYSNRLVRAEYDGPLVQVRRGSDNATQDFYGDANGNLTTRPFGVGTTLHSWLNGAVGYVARLYDQSGFEKHVSNPYIPASTSFPVSPLTGGVTNVNATVGGGVYIVSASDGNAPWQAFDNSLDTLAGSIEWNGAEVIVYNTSTGVYIGDVTTTDINSVSYAGEWFQIQLPVGIKLSSFIMRPRNDSAADIRSPRSFVLLGSTTGSSWQVVHSETNINNWVGSTSKTFTITSTPGVYKYYRLVVRRVGNYDTDPTGLWQRSFQFTDFKLLGSNLDTQPTIGTGIFPPMPMTANSTSLYDNVTYGSGPYVASASTTFSGIYDVWKAFDYNDNAATDSCWISAENASLIYNGTTGQYAGAVTTTTKNGTVYSGEWIQLQLPQAINLTSFSIFPRSVTLELAQKRAPRSFVILGSNNGTDWTLLDEETNVNDWIQAAKTFTVTPNSTSFNYFRMVVRRVGNFDSSTAQTSVNILHWMLYGNIESCTDITYNGSTNFLTTDTSIRSYPPQALTANTTALTTAEYDNGTYTASASTELNNDWRAWYAFDYNNNTGWHSADGNTIYNSTTGLYTGSVTTTDLNSIVYRGEWLQLQLPVATVLTHFTIVPRAGNFAQRSPRSFVVLGSNNGVNWSLVHEETNINNWGKHNNVFYIKRATSSYNYYRMVIRRVGNTGQDSMTSVQIMSWVLHSSKLPVMPETALLPTGDTWLLAPNPWVAPMTANTTVISGLTYIASASTEHSSNYLAWRAFDNTDQADFSWHSLGTWNATTGQYTGSVTTMTANGTSYLGEWLQIQLPSPVILSYFSMYGRLGLETNRSPRSFVVLGSNDASSWYLLHEETNVNDWTAGVHKLFNVNGIQQRSYRFFRIVVRRVGNSDNGSNQDTVQIGMWVLYGYRGAQKTTVFTDLKPLNASGVQVVYTQEPDVLTANGGYGMYTNTNLTSYFGESNDAGVPYNMSNYRRRFVLDIDHTLTSNDVVFCDNGSFFSRTSESRTAHSVGFNNFDIGGRGKNNTFYFNGVINEVIFFNETLQQSDILTYYQPTAKRAITNYTLKPKTVVRGAIGLPIWAQNANGITYIPTDWKVAVDTQHLGNLTHNTPLTTWRNTTAVNSPVYNSRGGNENMPYVNFARASSQYVNAGTTTLNVNSGGGFTAVAFVKFVNIGSTGIWQRLFDFGNGQGNNNILAHISEDNKTMLFYIFEANGTSGVVQTASNVVVEGEWAVWAFIYNATSKIAQIYKNGNLLASSSVFTTTPANRTLTNSYIGWSNWGGEGTANMHLAGLYMYDRPLSLTEIAAISNHLVMPVRKSISSLQDTSVVKANRVALPMGRLLGEPTMFFDGSNLNWVTVDDIPKQPFSFSFWFWGSSTGVAANMSLVDMAPFGKGTSNGIAIRYLNTTTIRIYASLPTAWTTLDFAAARDTWHHLTITVSATNVLNAYLNGTGKQTIIGSGAIQGLSRFFLGSAGNDGVDGGQGFKGYLQDFRVFDYVLRDDEVAKYTSFNYPILNTITTETEKYLVNRRNWFTKMTLTQQSGSFAASQAQAEPDVQFQLNNNTAPVINSFSNNFRIQDYKSFTCRFELYIANAVADALYFFCGSHTLPSSEFNPNGGYIVDFQVFTENFVPRGVAILDNFDRNICYSPWTYWIESNWMPVTITYTRGAINTWVVMMGEREVLTYSDSNNENWLTTSGGLWGIAARSGGTAMNAWIRGVELVYTEPRYVPRIVSYAPNSYVSNIVQNGLVAHFDPGIAACYPGSGTTLTSLVGSVTGTLGGTYSYNANGTIRLTNNTNNLDTNLSHLQLSSVNIQSISIWFYVHSIPTVNRYLLDMRTGISNSAILASSIGSYWSSGSLYKNGGTAQSVSWGNIETVGVWQNLTLVANTMGTDNATLFARFQTFTTTAPPPNEGMDVTFGPILIYNRVLTEAENRANYSTVLNTLPLFNNPNTFYTKNIVQNGLVAHFDPANAACYPGSGAALTSLVGSVTGTLGGTYSYNANGTIRLTNTNANLNNNTSYLQLSSITNVSTVSVWFYVHSTPTSRYLLDTRGEETQYERVIMSNTIGTNWSSGTLYKNGGSAQSITWANIETVGIWQNVTVIANTAVTDNMTLFARYTLTEGLDVTFGPIFVYNRVLTEAENDSNYNAVLKTLPIFNNVPRNPLSLSAAIADNKLISYPNGHLYNNSVVQSGLAAYFDPGNTSCYPGTGTTLRSLIGSVTGTLGGTYSYSNGLVRLSNTSANSNSNVSYLQLSSISTITTVSLWYYQHSAPTTRYLLDMRTGGSGGWIYGPDGGGTNWSSGTLYKNGGAAQSITWANIETVGVWQNVTLIANTSATDDMTVFSRFSQSEGIDVTFGPILVYNRAISQAENLQNYNAIKDTLGTPYNAKASSVLSSPAPEYNAGKAFDNTSLFWHSAQNYNTTTGAYTGSVTTTAGGIVYSGEWLQTRLNNSIRLKSYTITPYSQTAFDSIDLIPRSFVVLGSNDESTWNLIDERTGITDWGLSPRTFEVTRTPPTYAFYRLVAREVGGNIGRPSTPNRRAVVIGKWELNAYPNTVHIAPAINEYPPIALSSTSASVSSQNYGNGLYISSASSNWPIGQFGHSFSPFKAFNKTTNADGDDCWHNETASYNNSTGAYTGGISTTVDGSAYAGEWLQIQLPSAITLRSYSLQNRTGFNQLSQTWKVVGSNNGSTWSTIDTRTNVTDIGTGASDIRSFNVNATIAYSFYRIIGNVANVGGYFAIGEWRLYGQESTTLTGTKYPIAPLNTEYPRASLSYRQTISVPNNTTSTTYTYAGLGSPPNGTYNFWFRRTDLNLAWSMHGTLTISNSTFTNVLVTYQSNISFTSASGTNFTINPLSQTFANDYTMNLEPREEYPPSALSSNSTTLSSQAYGNGVYIASESSALGAGYGAWKALNKTNVDTNDTWHSTANSISASTPQWMQIQFPNQVTIVSYAITSRNDPSGSIWFPMIWRLQGSNDGSNWTDLESNRTSTTWGQNETKVYILTPSSAYRYFRLRVEGSRANSGDTSADNIYVCVGELRLFTAGSIVIPRDTYGNGRYSVSTSSNYFDRGYKESPWTIFNNLGPWATANGGYSTINGNYTGAISTTVQGTVYTGEWVQIELPTPIKLDRYDMQGGWASRNPKDFYIVGSNDGSNWTLLDTETNITGWTEWSGKRTFFTSNKSQAFTTFRLIVNKINNGDVAGLNALKLYALPEVSGNSLGSGAHTITSSSELTALSSGQCYPMNAFDDASNITYDTVRTFFCSAIAYNTTTGAYTGSASTLISGSAYAGEWLQIQLPSPIALTSYALTVRSDAPTSQCPNTWRIAGSNDGATWVLVDEEINVNNWTATNLTQTFTTGSSQRFSYFRMVCNVTGHNPISNRSVFALADWSLFDQSISKRAIVGRSARGLVDGLTWKFANGYHNGVANYFDTTPYTQIGRSSDLTTLASATNGRITTAQAMDTYSIEWTGYFRAPETGTYTFFGNSDDAMYIWIGATALSGYTTSNALLVDASGYVSSYSSVNLIAGTYYPIRILWGEGSVDHYIKMGFTTPSGVTITDGSGYFFSSTGTNAAYPAESAKVIKDITQTNTDGVYHINVNGVSEPTFCLMNDRYNGGGWMMLMKATRGNTFGYNTNYWTTANTLNATDTTRTDADAKYNTFNYKPIKDVMAIWPDISPSAYTNNFGNQGGSFYVEDGWVWKIDNWNGASMATALVGFQSSRTVTPQAPGEFNGYTTAWSAQSGIQAHVFSNGGLTTNGASARWGFLFNNEADWTSSDAFGGIGLAGPAWVGAQPSIDASGTNYSAGDVNNNVPAGGAGHLLTLGINRSARVEMFGR